MQKAKMKRTGFLSLALIGSFALGLGSCKKDKDHGDSTPPPPGVSKIKEYKNGDEFVRFTYNGDGTIKTATVSSELNTGGEIVDYHLSYNAQKKIAEITTSRAGEKIVPVYENGVLARADYFDGPVRILYTNYQWENDLLKRATLYLNQGADFEPYLEFIFSHNGENLSKIETFMATNVPNQLKRAGHVTFQVDQKTNPLFSHKEFLALLWQAPSKNNITREEHYDENQQLEDVYTYNFTYKNNGLPEKAVVTNGQPPVTTNVEYVYE